jgi:hypothetical protein
VAGLPLQPQAGGLVPLPKHKFLVGIHKAKSGTALGGSLLRPLAWWWCAANFSADWLLNLAQVFGLPFRWATYEPHAPQATVDAICTMLQNMGSAGWAAFPTGTTLDLKEASKPGGDHSPQGELLDRADRYARLVVLGQTMSGSQDASKGGGKAFGAVESDVKGRRIAAAAKYVCQVLNSQLVPSILTLNYGDAEECPCVRLITEEQGDLEQAQRDKVLADAGLEIPVSFLRKKYGLPAPCDGEETIGGRGMEQGAGDEKDEGDGWDEEDGALDARELARVAAIEDDAVFARELQKLTGAISAMGNSNGSRKGWDTRGRGRRDEESRIKENIQRGRNAIRHVLATQRDVMNAMSRPDIGPIDFVWERLDKRGNSRGIKHLLERRGAEDHAVKSALSPDETAEKMVEVIALGKIANPDVASGAVVIDHEGFRVVLGRAGKKTNAWLITGFEKRRDGTR